MGFARWIVANSNTLPIGVVVIDDQPEVSIDDPAFLFESNEGFQEVTSRKTLKASKLKAAAQEEVILTKPETTITGKKKEKDSGKVQPYLILQPRLCTSTRCRDIFYNYCYDELPYLSIP